MQKHRILISILFLILNIEAFAQRSKGIRPDYIVAQHAGSIGMVSFGAGYNVFKTKARASIHYGYVPGNYGGPINIIAAKFFYVPTELYVWNRVRVNPIDIGVMGSFHYGSNFDTRWPDGKYPDGYYWWHPALRMHIAIESAVRYDFRKDHPLRSISAYVELNTNELYFISFIQNPRALRLWDVVKLGTGARLYFK